LFTTYLSLTVFMVLFAWLLMHRFRLAWLSERAADSGLEGAIAERRAEAAGTTGGQRDGAGGAP
jgi:heme exporter protein C